MRRTFASLIMDLLSNLSLGSYLIVRGRRRAAPHFYFPNQYLTNLNKIFAFVIETRDGQIRTVRIFISEGNSLRVLMRMWTFDSTDVSADNAAFWKILT